MRRGARLPQVWAHFDRYFVTGEVLGEGPQAALVICVSRWSPRNDWQVIKIELRDLEAAKYERISPPVQRVERRPKAQLMPPRRVRSGWFPEEAELVRLQPISAETIALLGPGIRNFVAHHVLAYDFIEDPGSEVSDRVVLTARRYRQLVNLGETSPAAVISEATGIPVRTIQNRLRLARERGLLPHSGQGARRQADALPPRPEDLRLVAPLVGAASDPRPKRKTSVSRSHRTLRPRGRAPITRV